MFGTSSDISGELPTPSIEVVLAQAAAFRAEDRDGWPGAARASRVVELSRAAQAITASLIDAIRDFDRDQAWATGEYTSLVSWLSHACEITGPEANRRVKCARLIREQERTGKAFDDDDVSVVQLEHLAQARYKREAAYDDEEESLLTAVGMCEVRDLSKVTKRWAMKIDDRRTPKEAGDVKSRLHASVTFGGCVAVDALLDAEDGAILMEALRKAVATPEPGDERGIAERRAEALIDLVTGTKKVTVNLDVIVDADTLAGRDTNPADVRCDISHVGPIPRSLAERLACDACIGRVVMKGKSVPIDVSRSQRLATPEQWRALIARDGGCRYPGCGRHHKFCVAHHIIPWSHGGKTDLSNLILLCKHHHRHVHREQLHIDFLPSGNVEFRSIPP